MYVVTHLCTYMCILVYIYIQFSVYAYTWVCVFLRYFGEKPEVPNNTNNKLSFRFLYRRVFNGSSIADLGQCFTLDFSVRHLRVDSYRRETC